MWLQGLLLQAVLLFGLFGETYAAKILLGYAPQSLSHFRSMLPLANRLARAGHEITVIHTLKNPDNTKFQPNITAILIPVQLQRNDENQFANRIWGSNFHGISMFLPNLMLGTLSRNLILDHADKFRELLNQNWDLVLADSMFNGHMYAIAEQLQRRDGTPFAAMATTSLLVSDFFYLGISDSLAIAPCMFGNGPLDHTDVYTVRSFTNRLLTIVEKLSEIIASVAVEHLVHVSILPALGARRSFRYTNFVREADWWYTDSPEFIMFLTPRVNDVIGVGAVCDTASELSKEYLDFVEDPASKGTIYIAFGTIISWDVAPTESRNAFFDALTELADYRIVFSYNGKLPIKGRLIPSHIRMVKWVPQLNLLAHKNTKLFLTHGGLKSVKESLCTQTPMLVLPMFAEQARNARLVLQLGIGGALNKFRLSSASILDAIRNIMDNEEKYATRVSQMHAMYIDRPAPDLDVALHYTERLMRQRETNSSKVNQKKLFFERASMHQTLTESAHVEILAALLLLTLSLSY